MDIIVGTTEPDPHTQDAPRTSNAPVVIRYRAIHKTIYGIGNSALLRPVSRDECPANGQIFEPHCRVSNGPLELSMIRDEVSDYIEPGFDYDITITRVPRSTNS